MKVGRAIRMDSFMGDRRIEIRRIVRESFEVTEEDLNDQKFTVSSSELKGVLKRPSYRVPQEPPAEAELHQLTLFCLNALLFQPRSAATRGLPQGNARR